MEMGFKWDVFWCAVLLLNLHINGCSSLNSEGLALLEFRSRVVVDPHRALENWDPEDSDPCDWNGVHCVDGKVEMLKLKELSLGGTLGPELGNLFHLRAIVLYKNNFVGVIPKEIGALNMLELLDLRDNNFSGSIPTQINEMPSLKHLLLCGNKFQGCSSPWNEMPNMDSGLRDDRNLFFDEAMRIVHAKTKVSDWFKFKSALPVYREREGENIPSFTVPSSVQNIVAVRSVRRRLLEETSNLPAASVTIDITPPVTVPSIGSGSYPAVPSTKIENSNKKQPSAPTTSNDAPITPVRSSPNQTGSAQMNQTDSVHHEPSASKRLGKWPYIVVFPATALLLIIVAFIIVMCRRQEAPTIGPWKSGLSGQLKKAFVTGVPKLNRTELVAACEDFSNIISKFPDHTVFKGTLSSGVEIAVVSTAVQSAKDWPKSSETCFRKKIEMLSRVNHKNFVNLLGYCEDNEPFTRMMVFEYAPNGTLYEHLHVKEFDHLDWNARVRIIMGITYCLRYMHHELTPPIVHLLPHSASIFITDDYAAKVADIGIWKELVSKGKISEDDGRDPSGSQAADAQRSVHNFGVLLLEIISGRSPYSEEQGSLVNWGMEHLQERRRLGNLVDSSLKSHKDEELCVICEVIVDCINQDPTKRPSMIEITSKLRNVIEISPEAATPRLSPLWWAELEILSVQSA